MTRIFRLMSVFLILAALGPVPAVRAEDQAKAREDMVRSQIEARGVRDPLVLQALRRVPRHAYVPAALQGEAYADRPLPIGFGQTISQPYIVAYMTEVLGLKGPEKVLEIGTGSGYQAAVLAEILLPRGGAVHSIEIVPQLQTQAQERLKKFYDSRLGLKLGDGYFGWAEAGPFDGIIVTCAAGHIPPPLIRQLKAGGRMVIPVGPPLGVQTLVLAKKEADGRIRTESLLGVRFVPLVRPGGN